MNPEWYQEMEERENLSSEDEGNFADDFSDEEPDEARLPLPKSPVRQPTPLMTQSTPSPSLTSPTVALQLTPDNTLWGQRELICQQVEEIREARGKLAVLKEEIAAADQHKRDNARQRAAIQETVVAYDNLRKRRRLNDAKMKKERAWEKDFRDAVIELYSVLRRDDD
jgi:hypothetical protein